MVVDITGKLAIDLRACRDTICGVCWCKLPYPGHQLGCPMWDTRPQCPPRAPLVYYVYNLKKPHWLVVARFDLKAHAEEWERRRPHWTERQRRNSRYWQAGVVGRLRDECELQVRGRSGLGYEMIPEAMGINVFQTLRRVGVCLQRRPDMVHKVALVAHRF